MQVRPASAGALLAFAPFALAQTNWYVDGAAAPGGNGTQAQPFTTIAAALANQALLDGDTVLVAPGVYGEAFHFSGDISIRSTGGPLVTVVAPPSSVSSDPPFEFDSLEGAPIEVAGFTFLARAVSGPGTTTVRMVGSTITLRECIVIGRGAGIGVASATGTVRDCAITGFHRGLTDDFTIAFPKLRDSIVWGNTIDLSGVNASYSVFGTQDSSVVNNCIQAPPQWFNAAGNDFHLMAGSPCIDAADPASALDPDGSRNDIGPLMFDATYVPFSVYCTAKTNSQGCVPAVAASGNASYTANVPFTITCTNELNQRLGMIFYGFAPKNAAYQGGYLCVQAPVKRTALINSGGNVGPDDCSGAYSFDFNARIRSHVDPALEPGAEVFAQFWSRDPAASFTTNRSDAVRFRIQP